MQFKWTFQCHGNRVLPLVWDLYLLPRFSNWVFQNQLIKVCVYVKDLYFLLNVLQFKWTFQDHCPIEWNLYLFLENLQLKWTFQDHGIRVYVYVNKTFVYAMWFYYSIGCSNYMAIRFDHKNRSFICFMWFCNSSVHSKPWYYNLSY